MANYTGIQGQNILIVDTDPANPVEGQIWYNSTSNLLKGYANVVTNAWASGGNLTASRYGMGGAGTQTAGLGFGGGLPSSNVTQQYDGSTWTNVPGTLNTARQELVGCGTQTAALGFGGYNAPPTSGNAIATEKYDGSTWTTSGNVPYGIRTAGAAGTQTAALGFGGYATSPTGTSNAISFNGTSWSPITSLPSNRNGPAGFGTQTAAVSAGGRTSTTDLANTEEWNGSAWTAGGNLGTARYQFAGSGVESAGIVFGGFSGPAVTGSTELYNGSTWTAGANMTTARRIIGSSTAAPSSASLVFGGLAPATSNATEEWTGTAVAVRTITTS